MRVREGTERKGRAEEERREEWVAALVASTNIGQQGFVLPTVNRTFSSYTAVMHFNTVRLNLYLIRTWKIIPSGRAKAIPT